MQIYFLYSVVEIKLKKKKKKNKKKKKKESAFLLKNITQKPASFLTGV